MAARRWRPAFHHVLAAAALVVLAVVTTGLTAFDRGLFQDDAHILARVFSVDGNVWEKATLPLASPTRHLQSAPFALALLTPDPLSLLRIVNEALLLAIGLVTMVLAQSVLRAGAATAFLAGALTITASSDWMTASMISMGYHLAVVLHLIGALCLVRWTDTGRRWWLMTALAGGTASLWTLDAAATVHPLTPLLAWAVARSPESRRRLFVGAAAWWACAVPYYIAFLTFLADSTGYAADAIVPSSGTDRILRLADLFAYNFQPWVWAFARPQWYAPVHPHSSWFDGLLLAVVGAAVAAVAFVRLRRGDQALVSQPRAGWPARAWLVAVFIAFTALANATFMAVHLAEFHYRTQLLSRVWASLALAAAVTIALDRGRVARFVAVGVGMAFIVLGILGGRERQAYFSDYWQRHQRELASIADIVRRLPLDATLVLRRAAESRFAATEAPYLARAWTTLLSADPTLECRTFLASADRGTHCSPEPDALVCRGDVSPRCGIDAERGMRVPYDRLVVMTYDPVQPGFGVDATLPATFTPRGAAGATSADRYAPERLFIERPASWLARSLLR